MAIIKITGYLSGFLLFVWLENGLLNFMNVKNDAIFAGSMLAFILLLMIYCKIMYQLLFKRKNKTNEPQSSK